MDVNNSTQDNETFSLPPPISVHTRITLWSILLVWSLFGNVLVIAVVYCNQNLRTYMNYLIVNMAVSDLLVPLVAMPWTISSERRPSEWLLDGRLCDALCQVGNFLSEISPFVSSVNLVIIAFQRFYAVVYPRHILTRKTKLTLVSLPWIAATALFSPYFYIYRLENVSTSTLCRVSWSTNSEILTVLLILISIQSTIGFVIPLIIIIILYSIIQYKLRKSLNNVMELIEKEAIRSRQRTNRRIFRMSIAIVVLFIICWCPLSLLGLLVFAKHFSVWSMNFQTRDKLLFAFYYLYYLQAAINPCIYFVFLRDFRRGLKNLCCRKPASANQRISPA